MNPWDTRPTEVSEGRAPNMELSSHNRSAHKNLLLSLLRGAAVGALFYALFPYIPDFAQLIILLVAVVAIWWDPDFPKGTSPSYATALFWFPIVPGLLCGVVWKITGEEIWARTGYACICVRALSRVTNWAGTRLP